MGDPSALALQVRLHGEVLPALDRAADDLAAGRTTAAANQLARAHDAARALLDDDPGDSVDGGRAWATVVRAALDEVRSPDLAVPAAILDGPSGHLDPDVAAVVRELVHEAAANTRRHRRDAVLATTAAADPGALDLVLRSTGPLQDATGDESDDGRRVGAGRGLDLLRRRVAQVDGDLAVLHDTEATVLLARFPLSAARGAPVQASTVPTGPAAARPGGRHV